MNGRKARKQIKTQTEVGETRNKEEQKKPKGKKE